MTPSLAALALLACSPTPAPVVPGPGPGPAERPSEFDPTPPESPRLPASADAVERWVRAAGVRDGSRVAVTLDRPLYRPGDTVWARVWELGGANTTPTSNVTLEIRNPRGISLVRQRYANSGAGASAAADLPPDVAGGLYTLVATAGGHSVERPFVVAGFEEPRIRKKLELLRDAYGPGDEVVASLELASSGRGPLVDHVAQVLVQVDGVALPAFTVRTDTRGEASVRFTLPDRILHPDVLVSVSVEEEGWTESVSREVPVVLDRLQVELFPEGGTLVSGLPGRVYLRVRDAAGQAADASGVVEDDHGVEVATFQTLHDGLGRFEFTPRPGVRYAARLTEPVAVEPVPVPAAVEDGCVLRSFDDFATRRPEVRVGVWCSEPRTVVATGFLAGHAFVPASVRAGPDEPAVVHLLPEHPTDALVQGVAQVTLLDAQDQPVAERLVYRNPTRDLSVTVEPVATRFGPRDEVVLQVTTRDPSGEPVAADVALSVVDDRLLKYADDRRGHLESQLHLDPWIRGTLEDPAWYFDPEQGDATHGLDLVLGTFGWRTFARVPVTGRAASPDAGEGGRARREEGKVGKGPGRRVPVAPEPGDWGALGGQALDLQLAGGLGGLIGGAGEQLGAGGLGALGAGLGGGGASGASGYGKGGGSFGAMPNVLAAPGGDPIIQGALGRDEIHAVVRRHFNVIKYCYQRALTKNPELAGKVVEKFTIASDGTVSAAATKTTSMHDEAVEACITGRFRRMEFPKPNGGGSVIVTYPFVFAPGEGTYREGSPPEHTAVRVFAQPDYAGAPAPAVRTDFRSTVAWFPSVVTDAEGQATVKFFLADQVTTWRVTAEGVGGPHVGRVERELHSTLPFSLDAPLPVEVSFGDRLLVPVRLSNRRSAAASVTLDAKFGSPLVAEDGTDHQEFTLAGDSGEVTYVPITVPDLSGTATVDLTASAAGLADALHRDLVIAPRGFPHRFSVGGTLGEGAVHVVTVPEALDGGTSGRLTLYPNLVSSLIDGIESMVRSPIGCFEQTSSSNHPNVLILEYLDRVGGGASLQHSRSHLLREGYNRLTAYQVQGGGFETFGQGPGKEALSAYGVLQFTRMQRVFPQVDPHVIERDAAFLLQARDGTGGYRSSGTSSHQYGRAPAEVNDAYITHALVATGLLTGGPEVDRQRSLGQTTSDPYLAALATLTLHRLGDPAAARVAGRLAAMQSSSDGSFPGAKSSVESGGGRDLVVETTALAALALSASGRPDDALRAVRWLGEARQGSGGWGNTQATVLALEAISTIGAQASSPGEVEVLVDGSVVGSVRWTGHEHEGAFIDLGRWLSVGTHEIRLRREGGDPVPYTLEATWRRVVPDDAPGAPLHLATSLAADSVALGGVVRMTATLTNTSAAPVRSPLARIGLPAGVHVEQQALQALRDQGRVSFFETRPREITLYWEGLAAGAREDLVFDLVADVPGTFHAPPSVTYPYYSSDVRDWEEGATLRITP